MQRFSPRVKNSSWNELNKERARWLIKKNLMHESGFSILPALDDEFEYPKEIITALREDEEVWNNFISFPELYKKIEYLIYKVLKNIMLMIKKH